METRCYQCGLTNWPGAFECGRCAAALGGENQDRVVGIEPPASGGGVKLIIILGFVICVCTVAFLFFNAGPSEVSADAAKSANPAPANTPPMATGVSAIDPFEKFKKADEENRKKWAAMSEQSDVNAQIRQVQQFTTGRGQGKWDNLECVRYRVAANGVRICDSIGAR